MTNPPFTPSPFRPFALSPFRAFLFLSFFALLNAYGQEILPKEQEREIKTSGRYYFSECSAFEEAIAKECALKDLTQEVLIDIVRQSIKSDETLIKKTIEMRAKTASLSMIGKIKILAWIEKDSVLMSTTSEPTPMSEPTPTPTSTPTPESTPTPASTPPPSASTIANPVVRDLASCETFDQFRRMADGFKRQGKLIYGASKASFANPDQCLVAVFSPERKLIALLDAGQGARKDLMTGNTIQNAEQHFAGNNLFWINVNN